MKPAIQEVQATLDKSNISSLYNYYINTLEDPRVKQWYIISSPFPTILIIVLYLVLIYKLLPNYMQNRQPFKLTNLIRFYNLSQVIICLVFVYQTVTPLSTPLYVWKCEHFKYSNDIVSLRRVNLGYYWYILKATELFETIFFILRKKFNQVTLLHVHHHITTFLTAWYFGKYFSGGLACFCIMLNASVHVIMYMYYFLATLGPFWQKYIKKYKSTITTIQIIQLFTLLCHSSQIVLNEDCNLPHIAFYAYGLNVALMLMLFLKFFCQNYNKNSKKVN